MSIQIKKKFIKSQVIDGTKVLFLNEDAFKASKADGSEVSLFKVSSSDEFRLLQMPKVSADPSADDDLSRKKYVDDSLNVEMLAREAGDETLQENLDAEVARAEGEEARIEGKLDAEITNRIAAVTAEEAARIAGDSAEQSARIAAVSAEEAARIAGDLEEKTRAEAAELTLNGLIEAVNQSLDDESIARIAGDAALASDLSDAVASLQAAITAEEESRIADDDAEEDARLAGDQALQAAIDAEAVARAAADTALQVSLDAEVAARVAAVSAEEAARIAGDAAEQARAMAAEAALEAAIDAEEARAMAAEGVLTSDLASEVATRTSEVSRLDGRIDNVLSNTDPAALDSLSEIVTAFQEADGDLNQAITDLAAAATSALNAEVARAQAAEAGLASDISDEETRAMAAEAGLASDLAAEVARATAAESAEAAARAAAVSAEAAAREAADSAEQAARIAAVSAEEAARIAAVSAEQTAREAADSALDARLDILEADPVTKTYVDGKVSELTTDITDLDGYAQDIRSDLDQEILDRAADVDAEEARAMAAEAVLTSSINSEVSARQAAVSAEEAARIAGDASLLSSLNTEITNRQAAVSAEEAARIQGDLDLASDLSDEEAARIAGDAALQSSLSTEIANRISAVSSEAAAREAADDVLDAKIDQKYSDALSYTDSKVAALVNSAPEVLDTLKELADALGSDPNFATTVAGQIGTEQARAEAAEAALDARLDALEGSGSGSLSYELNAYGERMMSESFEVDASMISDGYLELGFKAFAPSMVVSLDRLMLFEGDDFIVSVVGGVTRLTFAGSILPMGDEALASGDKIKVRYLKDVR